jgi:hypothetical protein
MAVTIIWDLDEEVQGNIQHIEEHGIDKEDVAHVFENPYGFAKSKASSLPMVFGFTIDDRYIAVIYERIDNDRIYPVTAFEVPEPS